MKLVPRRPPGRATRKAAVYADEILRLRAEGYMLAAIHEALADVGIVVSKSTVKREMNRCSTRAPQPAAAPVVEPSVRAMSTQPPAPALVTPAPPPSLPPPSRTGKEIAESFVKDRITNPLLRNRSNHEDRRH